MVALIAVLLLAQASGPIDHTPLARASRGLSPSIKVVVRNPSENISPLVFARAAGKGRFFGYPMIERGKDWVARLPGSVATGDRFEYFIEARLRSGERAQLGSEAKPFVVMLEDAPIRPAIVTVTSAEGAVVSLDAKEVGPAPQTIESSPGAHQVSVQLPDGRGSDQSVDFVAGKTKKVHLVPSSKGGPGELQVMSEPSGARLYFDGAQIGATPYKGEAIPGKHKLALELNGFLRQERDIELREGRDSELRFSLVTLPKDPALSVESTPQGAQVFIDGAHKGVTPWLGPLGAGRHEVVLKMTGRREVATDFEMPEGRDLSLRLEMAAPAANEAPRLLVFSKPEGATVQIDGEEVGSTPWSGEIKPGPHKINLARDGYLSDERTITAQKNREAEVSMVLQRPPGPARLMVETDPPGGEVRVDGNVAGTTPLQQEIILEPGEHQVEARMDGFLAVAQTVSVEQSQSLALRLAMAPAPKDPLPPTIAVNTEPQGARLYLDGKLVGETPVRKVTVPGPHDVKILLDGYVSRTTKIKLPEDSGFELRLALNLKKVRGSDTLDRPDPTAMAKSQLHRALTCYKLADYPCALTNFKSVYEVRPIPEVLFNIGQTQRKLGNLKESIVAFRGFLKDNPTGTRADQARKFIAQMEEALARGESKVSEDDQTPPVIHHTPVARATRGEDLKVEAVVTDDKSGVAAVQVCYRNVFALEYKCLAMAGTGKDEYTVAVPSSAVTDGFAYYVEATDNAGNGPVQVGSKTQPNTIGIEEPGARNAVASTEATGPVQTQIQYVPVQPTHVFGRGDWRLEFVAGAEHAGEDYVTGYFLGKGQLSGSRLHLFGAQVAHAEIEVRNGALDYRNYQATPGQPQTPFHLGETRTRLQGGYGIDVLRQLHLSEDDGLTFVPSLYFEYQRIQNDLFPFNYAGFGVRGDARWEVLGPVAVSGAVTFSRNLASSTAQNGVGDPRRDFGFQAGVEIALPPRYAAHIRYTSDVLMFANATRFANGVVAGLGATF